MIKLKELLTEKVENIFATPGSPSQIAKLNISNIKERQKHDAANIAYLKTVPGQVKEMISKLNTEFSEYGKWKMKEAKSNQNPHYFTTYITVRFICSEPLGRDTRTMVRQMEEKLKHNVYALINTNGIDITFDGPFRQNAYDV